MKSTAQRRQLLIFLGALLIAAGIGVNLLLPKLFAPPNTPIVGTGPTTPIVVTAVPVIAGGKFTTDNLTTINYPALNVPSGAFTNVSQVAGKYATIALPAHIPVTPEMLVNTAAAAGGVTASQLLTVPEGDIPYTIAYDSKTMGYFSAGEHVDVIVTQGPTTQSVFGLSDLTILKMGNPTEQGSGAVGAAPIQPSVMVLIVTRSQALQLNDLLVGRWNGTAGWAYRFVLRSPDDTVPPSSAPAP